MTRATPGRIFEWLSRAVLFLFISASTALAQGSSDRTLTAAPFMLGVGVHVAQNKSRASDVLRLTAQLGVNSIRDEIYWDDIEKTPGIFSIPSRLNDLDILFGEPAIKRGIRPMIILNYGNRNYEAGGFPTTQESITAFSRYAAWVSNRYRSSAVHFEIWNEWNNGIGLPPTLRRKGTPSEYIKLLAAASRAVKAQNPHAIVIAGAVAGFDEAWIKEFIDRGGMRYADGFSVHPYTFFDRMDPTPELAIRHLDRLNQMFQQATGRSVPIYVTEIGWPTHSGRIGVTEVVQSDYLVKFFALARSKAFVRGVWWYELIDSGDNEAEAEHRFGLFRQLGARKESRIDLNQAITTILSADRCELLEGSSKLAGVTCDLADLGSLIFWQKRPVRTEFCVGDGVYTGETPVSACKSDQVGRRQKFILSNPSVMSINDVKRRGTSSGLNKYGIEVINEFN